MTISRYVQKQLASSSWIRKMFETGLTLKARLGAENVFDLSLGNPNLEPPQVLQDALRDLILGGEEGVHRYMPNPGFPSTRKAIAGYVTRQEGVDVDMSDVVMTVGAAGALNVALASILNPGEEVLVLAPFFMEYNFYAHNHRGEARVVPTREDFDLDLDAIDAALSHDTRAIILNTPNNPTGKVYSQQRVAALGELLLAAQRRLERDIYLLVDTPYARLTFNGVVNPKLFPAYPNTMIAHSFSKELGIAGERLGFLAINPASAHRANLQAATAFNNRVLGFVNAPALMQRALEKALDASVNVAFYQDLRDLLCAGLEQAGYDLVRPDGAFYAFPRTPIPDDIAFCSRLAEKNVLVVPGSGFGRPGYMRIAFCVAPRFIEGALPILAEALKQA